MRVFKSPGGVPNAERIGYISSIVRGNSAAECLFRDYFVWSGNASGCGEVCAKVVEGKEKDVIKTYIRDAGGFVGWDYTSEENTST